MESRKGPGSMKSPGKAIKKSYRSENTHRKVLLLGVLCIFVLGVLTPAACTSQQRNALTPDAFSDVPGAGNGLRGAMEINGTPHAYPIAGGAGAYDMYPLSNPVVSELSPLAVISVTIASVYHHQTLFAGYSNVAKGAFKS